MANSNDTIPVALLLNFETRLLLAGFSVGLLADLLLWEGGLIGPGFLVWLSFFSAVGLWMKYQNDGAWSTALAAWSLVAIVAATLLLFRTTIILVLLLWLTIIIAAALVLLNLTNRNLRQSTVADFLYSQLCVFVHAFVGSLSILRKIDLRIGLSKPRVWAFIRGALIVFPLLVVFASLFASADVVFNSYVRRLTDIFSAELPRHLFMIGFFAWAATGLLAAVCVIPAPWKLGQRIKLKLGADETAVIMGALVVLFVAFVVLQLSYLFGGREMIEATSQLTLAEYARRGFFELVSVATLTLGLLIAFASSCGEQRLFRPLALILVCCVFIILISAAQRMLLYVESFGLTIDRLTVLAFMNWLGFALVMFTGTVLRGRVKDFMISLAIAGIALVFLFAAVNPAALVARVNIDRSINNAREVDALYLLRLGSDAVPAVMERFSEMRLSALDECHVASQLLRWSRNFAYNNSSQSDWRRWSASRAAAGQAVLASEAELTAKTLLCP